MALITSTQKAQEFAATLTLDNEGLPPLGTDQESLMSLVTFPDVKLGKEAWSITRMMAFSRKAQAKREAQLVEQVVASTNKISGLRLNRKGTSIAFYAGEQILADGTHVGGRHVKSYVVENFELMHTNRAKIDELFQSEIKTYWQMKPETVYQKKPVPAVPAVILHKPANTFTFAKLAEGEEAEKIAAAEGLTPCNPNPKEEADD